jgi:TolA-binding protein
MRFLRLATLVLCGAVFCFGASKEMVELQRDVALLQDQANRIQRTLDEKLAAIQVLLQQTQENSSRAAISVQNMQTDVATKVGEQMRPLLGVAQKVDGMQEEMRGLKDSMSDLSARLDKLDAKVTDVSNKISLSNQPPPPTPGGGQSQAGGTGPSPGPQAPAGMSAETTFADAQRDEQAGNYPVALKEYQDYLTYFGQTDQAPSAQYHIGLIFYNEADMDSAVKAFDTVLEKYPENTQTPNAYYMKSMALLRSGKREPAIDGFKALIEKYPRTDQANKARSQMRALGVLPPADAPKTKRRPSN